MLQYYFLFFLFLLPYIGFAQSISNITDINNGKDKDKVSIEVNNSSYINALSDIRKAITSTKPQIAQKHFEPNSYSYFAHLITSSNRIKLTSKRVKYDFIEDDDQIIARYIPISIKYKSTPLIYKNLLFRFNKSTHKIESFAFALKPEIEEIIFNDAAKWPNLSRYTIMKFLEDYQTAYALKRFDYISQIYSDNAIIINGSNLITATKVDLEGRIWKNNYDTQYNIIDKATYLSRLSSVFKTNNFISLNFESAKIKCIRNSMIPIGTAFAIEIAQHYNSSNYSDKGYLSLLLDVTKVPALIHIRLWQPKQCNIDIESFINTIKL